MATVFVHACVKNIFQMNYCYTIEVTHVVVIIFEKLKTSSRI